MRNSEKEEPISKNVFENRGLYLKKAKTNKLLTTPIIAFNFRLF
jgi:hypothetical protein